MLNINWKIPKNVGFAITSRQGGVSQSPFNSLNLGDHVKDNQQHVLQNRQLVQKTFNMPAAPTWLQQVHGIDIVNLDNNIHSTVIADGSYTTNTGKVCVVMTADCLPLLLCNKQGTEIAAVHAGWRGLCDGVIESAVKKFRSSPQDILALIGPCIGPHAFEVGQEVYHAFVAHSQPARLAFSNTSNNKYMANLALLAKQRLNALDVNNITQSNLCTYANPALFFSYRRQAITGRMASFIWIK